MRSNSTARFRDLHEVFDPEAAEADTIEARFDSHDVAGAEFSRRRGRFEGILVDQQSDAVTDGVRKPVGVAGFGDELAARRIDVPCGDTSAHGFETGDLNAEQEIVDLGLLVGRRPDDVAPRHVGVIAVDEPSHVDHHGVALHDPAVTGLVVRASGVLWTGRDDRVVARPVGTVEAHAVFEFSAHVGLGHPSEQRGDLGERRIRGPTGGDDPCDLTGVLRASPRPPAGRRRRRPSDRTPMSTSVGGSSEPASTPTDVTPPNWATKASCCSACVNPVTTSPSTPAAASSSAARSR